MPYKRVDELAPQVLEFVKELKSYKALIDALSAPAAPQALSENDHVMESWLCESRRLVLRIGQLYRFKVDPTCATCVAMKAEHDSAYGAAGITVWEGG